METRRGCAEVDLSPERASPCFEAMSADFVMEAFEKAVIVTTALLCSLLYALCAMR